MKLTIDDLLQSEDQTHSHDGKAEHDTRHRRYRLPTSSAQLNVAQWRENICKSTSTRRPNQFEDRPKVASEQADCHRTDDQSTAED